MTPTLVFVTGVCEFVGSHIARQLLDSGYAVLGSVRTHQDGEQITAVFQSSNFSFLEVKDIAKPHAFDSAVTRADYVIHADSPYDFDGCEEKADIVDFTVLSTLEILKSAAAHGGRIKRIVITSSAIAMRTVTPALAEGISEVDWNMNCIVDYGRLGSASPSVTVFPAAKTLAERAAWDFMTECPRNFDLTSINPSFVIGPIIHPCSSINDLSMSVKVVADFYLGNMRAAKPGHSVALGFVDVRDVARAHVLAVTNPSASGKRFLLSAGPFRHQNIVAVLRKRFPGRSYVTDITTAKSINEVNAMSKEVLGIGSYIDFETTIVDTVKSLQGCFEI
ncbi:hypothetical protein HDU83_001942 [Entophlyctis luteolus]|nr:hypothetical protein HDU83_001942 [Entophlyctis luteolus]